MSSRPPRDLHSSEELLRDDDLEPERYELDEAPAYRFEHGSTFDLDRRGFLAVLGAGILVSVGGSISHSPRSGDREPGAGRGEAGASPSVFTSAWTAPSRFSPVRSRWDRAPARS